MNKQESFRSLLVGVNDAPANSIQEYTVKGETFEFSFPNTVPGKSKLIKTVDEWANTIYKFYKEFLLVDTCSYPDLCEVFGYFKNNGIEIEVSDIRVISLIKHTICEVSLSDKETLTLLLNGELTQSIGSFVSSNVFSDMLEKVLEDIQDAKND